MYNSRKHNLTIEHCQSCYKHPDLQHSESLYLRKYQQIEAELSKKSDRIILSKKSKFREGAFEIYFDRLLLYSKLNSPSPKVQAIKIKLQQLLMIIDCLILKSVEEFQKLKFKILTVFATDTIPPKSGNVTTDKQPLSKRCRIDLYSYLKKQLKENKFSLKAVNNAIVALIQPPLQLKTIPQSSRYTNQSRQITRRKRQNLKNKGLQKNTNKRQPLGQNTNMLESILISEEDQCKGLIKKSTFRNFNSSNLTRKKINVKKNMLSYFSVDRKQYTDSSDKTSNLKGKQISQEHESFNSKYCYLFKEVDQVPKEKAENDQYVFSMISQKKGLNFVDMSLDQINEEPSLLSLDSWEGNKSPSDLDSQNSKQILNEIIEKQGLKMNLPIKIAITKKKSNSRSSRKYSFLLNKEIENIERELKSQFGDDMNQQVTYSENLKFHTEIQQELSVKPPARSVKILQDQNNSSVSSDSLDLMQQQVNSKKIIRPSANCLSMRDILSNNKIENLQSENVSQNSVTSLDLKLITNQIYNGISDNIELKIQSKLANPTRTEESEKLFQDQYILSEFDANFTNIVSNKNFYIKLSNDHSPTLSKLAQIHNNFDHFIKIILQIQKLYSTQFFQIFGFVDFDRITLQSYLFYLMRDKYQEGQYQLESEINLEEFYLKLKLIDRNRQFIRVQVSLLILKKMRVLLEGQIGNERWGKGGKMDWLCLLYMGYLALQCWSDKTYNLDNEQIKLSNFKVPQNTQKQLNFDQLLNMIVGAPILNITTLNLRKLKHLIINKYLVGTTPPKNTKIVSLYQHPFGANTHASPGLTQEIKIAQVLQFIQNKQNILESIVKFKIFVDDDPTVQHQVLECKYQQFAIKYRELLICFHSDDLFYQQLISINPHPVSTLPSYKLLLEIPTDQTTLGLKPVKFIFDFSQIYSPSRQSNKKTIIAFYQVNKRIKNRKVKLNMNHMGEINRAGNFFFQLDLQPGIYYAQVVRQLEENEINCMKIISTSKITIMKEEVTGETQREFIMGNLGADNEL